MRVVLCSAEVSGGFRHVRTEFTAGMQKRHILRGPFGAWLSASSMSLRPSCAVGSVLSLMHVSDRAGEDVEVSAP